MADLLCAADANGSRLGEPAGVQVDCYVTYEPGLARRAGCKDYHGDQSHPELLMMRFHFFSSKKLVDILRRTLSDSGLRLPQDQCAPTLTENHKCFNERYFLITCSFLSFAPRQR
jgi:hypothetical protein